MTPAGANWISGEGDISNSRYSPLGQINSNNVQNLHVVWNQQFNTPDIQFSPEGQPICCPNNLLYQAYIQGVAAMAPDTGADRLELRRAGDSADSPSSGRGSASTTPAPRRTAPTLNLVYAGQQDGSIIAVDAKTGHPVWTTSVIGAGTYGDVTGAESAPFTQYYAIQGTNGILLSAPNGGESPFRGHLDAYDAKTGKLLWRAWNLPDPTQLPYILSWGNPAEAAVGGAADWSIPADRSAARDGLLRHGQPVPGDEPGAGQGSLDGKHHGRRLEDRGAEVVLPDDPPRLSSTSTIRTRRWWSASRSTGRPSRSSPKGSKGGFFYVLNAVNGGPVPHFKITETPTFDPSGHGHRAEQPVQVAAVPERRFVLHGSRRLLAGRPGAVPLPRKSADRRVRDGSR